MRKQTTRKKKKLSNTSNKGLLSGERIVPGKADPDLLNEHLVRYLFAREFCSGKHVLDIGCGVGYGCFRLAEVARRVVGLDNNPQALQYARSHYALPNINYQRGNCCQLPFGPRKFDVVTSFELIEHLSDAKSYLSEVRRVLKPRGLLLISTPNRPVYAERRGGEPNPFHIHEYELDEFLLLLKQYFAWVKPLGEVHVPAVGIFSYPTSEKILSLVSRKSTPEEADYFLCVCSQQRQKAATSLVLIPASGNVLGERERHIRLLSTELAERLAYLARLQAEFDEKAAWANRLNAQVKTLEGELEAKDKSLEQHKTQIQELTWLWQRTTARKRTLALSLLVPVDWLVGSFVILAEVLGRLLRRVAPKKRPLFKPADPSRCSIIVLSWEGKELLAESLPPLLDAVHHAGGDHEVIVVDNGSTDGTSEYVRSRFPQVRLVRNERNVYFSRGNNLGVRAATRDIVVLLNNDMIVDPNFLKPLLKPFSDSDVFAVGSQVFFADPSKRREETGKTRANFNGCDLDWKHASISPSDERVGQVPVFWAHGGAAGFDRRKFLWLGGFDTLYDPFYVEDADLSYRAWKVGWRCLVAVHSHVLHKHRASSRRFGERFIAQTTRRNHYLFLWKNFTDIHKLFVHFLRSTRTRIRYAGIPGVGIRLEVRAYLGAIRRLAGILRRRLQDSRSVVRTDDEVIETIETPPAEIISSSEIDFQKGAFQEYLGEGWYGLEKDKNGGYRWMSRGATVFLRTPAVGHALLQIEGHVPPLTVYHAGKLCLTVRIGHQSKSLHLVEGEFRRTWKPPQSVAPNTIQKVQLSIDGHVRETTDKRVLGSTVRRIAFVVSPPTKTNLLPSQTHTVADRTPLTLMRRRKRVLFISAYPPAPNTHAGGQRVFRIMQGLSRFYEVSLLTFIDEEQERERLSAVRQYCRDVVAVPRERFPANYDPWSINPRWLDVEYNSLEMHELVSEAASGGHYDLLQLEFLQMSQFLPERSRIPMLLTHHEVQSLAMERKLRQLPWLSGKRLRYAWNWMQIFRYELTRLPRFTGVIVLTEEERSYLQRYLPSLPLMVNHMGVDCSYFHPLSAPEDPNSLVFVGYFKHEPNIDAANWLLERIFPRILSRFPTARLYLVGNAPPRELESHANGLNINVTGWVPDIRNYLGRCTVFIAPLRLGAGMRGKILEAWAMARPIVCTTLACAGMQAKNEENVLVGETGDVLADHVCRLLDDEVLRRRLGNAGLSTVRAHYDWELRIQEHKAIYERVLG